jgi:hypothetical protein
VDGATSKKKPRRRRNMWNVQCRMEVGRVGCVTGASSALLHGQGRTLPFHHALLEFRLFPEGNLQHDTADNGVRCYRCILFVVESRVRLLCRDMLFASPTGVVSFSNFIRSRFPRQNQHSFIYYDAQHLRLGMVILTWS